ncbi:MAG: DUF808 domain-containing protein [Hyphomicrobiaceae bacterium]
MSSGLIAVLDHAAQLAKLAAVSLDDVAAHTAKAGTKAAGVVIDDAAVTPRYVVGFSSERELPVIGRIALGSLKNKVLFLLPGALVLSLLAPWAITPLLMVGGAYLCFEGYEKVHELIAGHEAPADAGLALTTDADGLRALEDRKVNGAIQTDLILSAEVMAITLASVAAESFWMQAFVLAVVGVGITAIVYGVVALIVKADDVGLALARAERPIGGLFRGPSDAPPRLMDRWLGPVTQAIGRLIVALVPPLLAGLSVVGTVAMLWVGGGIVLHGLEVLGLPAPAHAAHAIAHGVATAVAPLVPALAPLVEWATGATIAALLGIILGAATAVAVGRVMPLLAKR